MSRSKSLRKSVRIRSYSVPHVLRIWAEIGETLRISHHSVQMRENTDQSNPGYGHFLRSALRRLSFLVPLNRKILTFKIDLKIEKLPTEFREIKILMRQYYVIT